MITTLEQAQQALDRYKPLWYAIRVTPILTNPRHKFDDVVVLCQYKTKPNRYGLATLTHDGSNVGGSGPNNKDNYTLEEVELLHAFVLLYGELVKY